MKEIRSLAGVEGCRSDKRKRSRCRKLSQGRRSCIVCGWGIGESKAHEYRRIARSSLRSGAGPSFPNFRTNILYQARHIACHSCRRSKSAETVQARRRDLDQATALSLVPCWSKDLG